MTVHRGRSQYAHPFIVESLEEAPKISPLERVALMPKAGGVEAKFSEQWLQRLIFQRPAALPARELEPAVDQLVPMALEIQTPTGYIDNLYLTPEGHIVLAECKLWRNPEARRLVIAQILDYAQSMTRWTFGDLDAAVRKGRDASGNVNERSILDLMRAFVGEDAAFAEAEFIDAVQRNLRRGRMLLLIVGDGVREDVEGLADFLQMHAGFHFTLGLVEMAVFQLPTESKFLVQPRILARTLNIERAVVRLEHDQIVVQPVPAQAKGRVSTLSEEAYYEQLALNAPAAAQALKTLVIAAERLDIRLAVDTTSASLKWDAPSGSTFNLGTFNIKGRFETYRVGGVANELIFLPLAHEYLEQLALLFDACVSKTASPRQWCLKTMGGALLDAKDVLAKGDQWLALMKCYQDRILEASEQRD